MAEFLGCTCDSDQAQTELKNFIENPAYKEIYDNHDENLSQKIDNYLEIYQDSFQKFIGKEPYYLEIGVQNGGSLQIASKYFVNGHIYGIDVDQRVCRMNLGYNITTYCFDIKDTVTFQNNLNNINFDIILDDGSHINSDIITTFKILFPKVNPGGVYIAEDLHTSYWPGYEGGYLKTDSAIEYFKGFIDLLNSFHIDLAYENFIKNLSQDDRYVFEWLESLNFHDGIVTIKKLKEPRKTEYKTIVTGKDAPIILIQA